MAEALLKERLEQEGLADWHVESAGTWTTDGAVASRYAVQLMAQRGYDLSAHRSRGLDRRLMEQADLVMVMTHSHAEALCLEFQDQCHKVYMLSEMKGGHRHDVADPYGGPREAYHVCANVLTDLIDAGFERIRSLVEENARIQAELS